MMKEAPSSPRFRASQSGRKFASKVTENEKTNDWENISEDDIEEEISWTGLSFTSKYKMVNEWTFVLIASNCMLISVCCQ